MTVLFVSRSSVCLILRILFNLSPVVAPVDLVVAVVFLVVSPSLTFSRTSCVILVSIGHLSDHDRRETTIFISGGCMGLG